MQRDEASAMQQHLEFGLVGDAARAGAVARDVDTFGRNGADVDVRRCHSHPIRPIRHGVAPLEIEAAARQMQQKMAIEV